MSLSILAHMHQPKGIVTMSPVASVHGDMGEPGDVVKNSVEGVDYWRMKLMPKPGDSLHVQACKRIQWQMKDKAMVKAGMEDIMKGLDDMQPLTQDQWKARNAGDKKIKKQVFPMGPGS